MQVINFGNEVRTMSSREIAELTGKQHKDVLYDIRKMLDELGITAADFATQYKDSMASRGSWRLISPRCWNTAKPKT